MKRLVLLLPLLLVFIASGTSAVSATDAPPKETVMYCKAWAADYNRFLIKFSESEKRYSGTSWFGIFRLKYTIPTSPVDENLCESAPGNIGYNAGRIETAFLSGELLAFISDTDVAARAAAEIKSKQEADARAAAEIKSKQEADARAAAEKLAVTEKIKTIICTKGKLVKKITGVKPTCPKGYKQK